MIFGKLIKNKLKMISLPILFPIKESLILVHLFLAKSRSHALSQFICYFVDIAHEILMEIKSVENSFFDSSYDYLHFCFIVNEGGKWTFRNIFPLGEII
jgi:hypothetical protein